MAYFLGRSVSTLPYRASHGTPTKTGLHPKQSGPIFQGEEWPLVFWANGQYHADRPTEPQRKLIPNQSIVVLFFPEKNGPVILTLRNVEKKGVFNDERTLS
jgi:hypothetical protein